MSIVSPDVTARLKPELFPTVNSLYRGFCNLELVLPTPVASGFAYGLDPTSSSYSDVSFGQPNLPRSRGQ